MYVTFICIYHDSEIFILMNCPDERWSREGKLSTHDCEGEVLFSG